jgi:uncharacterized phage protein gp47/JayE
VYRAALDPGGTGAVNLAPGSRNDVAVSALNALTTRVTGYVADRVAAGRVHSATGEDLDILAQDFYQETRKPARTATGMIQLTRTGTGATTIPLGTRFAVPASSTAAAIVFQASQDVAVPSGQTTAQVPLVAA